MTRTSNANTVLAVRDLVAGYRPGLPIVRGASLGLTAGEIVTLLGPNGAGKSTLVKAVAGLVVVTSGTVEVHGRPITGTPAHALGSHGVAYVPQVGNVFARLGVAQNLAVSARRLVRRERVAAVARMCERFPVLGDKRAQLAGELSGGQRQLLALAMALLTGPRVLLTDEPTAGLAPVAAADILTELRRVADSGSAVLLVEQNVRAALSVSDRGVVLGEGREQLTGPAATLLEHPRVADLYLGGRLATDDGDESVGKVEAS